jgi:hypothetical protein
VLILAVFVAGYLGAKLEVLGTREVAANHNFSDVPDGVFYHDFVQFPVDSLITVGCAPSLFCGEQAVTRGQLAVFLKRLSDTFEIVHHPANFESRSFTLNTVVCPPGKRPLAGGGNTNLPDLFISDIGITTTSLTVRWESDNNTIVSGSSDAWALCAPA